jgi:hypothetical protein
MGATGTHREKGLTDAEFFQGEFREGSRILDAATKRGGVWDWQGACFMAVQDEEGVHAVIAFFTWIPSSYFNYTFKLVDESMGIGDFYECPARILDLLTPTDCDRSNEWREGCRKVLAKKAAKPKVKPGDTIRFAEPVEFTDGSEGDTFTLEGRSTFRRVDGYGRCRITKWRDRDYELVPA